MQGSQNYFNGPLLLAEGESGQEGYLERQMVRLRHRHHQSFFRRTDDLCHNVAESSCTGML